MPRLGLVLLLVPFLEFYVLVEVGARIGAFNAVLLVVLFAMAGVWLARTQGMGTLARIQQSLAQGVLPADEMLDGLFLLLAGILMVFPGFVTDAFGVLLLLLPPVRRLAAHLLRRHMNATIQAEGRAEGAGRRTDGSSVHVRTWYFGPGGARHTETFGGSGPMFGPGPAGPEGLGGADGTGGSHGSGPHPYGPDHRVGGVGSAQAARQEPRRTVVIDCEPVEPSRPADGSGTAGGSSGSSPDGTSDDASGGAGAR